MTCDDLDRLVRTTPLRALGAARLEATRAHAARCSRCRMRLDDIATLETTLGSLPLLEAPPGIADLVMERIATETSTASAAPRLPVRPRRGSSLQTLVGRAAALAGAVLLAGAQLTRLEPSGLTRALSPSLGPRTPMMVSPSDPATVLIATALGVALLAVGFLWHTERDARNR